MIKYEGGSKDVFKTTVSENKEITIEEKFTIQSGTMITLFFKESLNSKQLSNGQLIRLAVKEDVISDKGKVIIGGNIGKNTETHVKAAKSLGRKGQINLQINNVNAVDGTSISVWYNLNNEGKSRANTAVAVGVVLFWPALFIKGKQASIEAGTLILVETMGSTTLNTTNFEKRENIISKVEIIDDANNQTTEILEKKDPCGEEPKEPINTFNKYQFKSSKIYKSYQKELSVWKNCVGE